MFKPLSLFVALRYTRAKKDNHFISFISLVSMLGLTLGVAVLIIVLSVMNGFDQEMRSRILGMVPHASIEKADGIQHWQDLSEPLLNTPYVLAVAPFTDLEGMLTANGRTQAVYINGIDPATEAKVSIVQEHLITGQLKQLEPGEFGMIIGDILAARLKVSPGDKLTLILPEANLSAVGIVPRLKRFKIVGIFSLGAELDNNLALINIEDASKIKKISGVQGIRLKLDNLFLAPYVAQTITRELRGGFTAHDWTESYGSLFRAIQLEKRMVGLLLFLIITVAAFNIISALVMIVTDKQADIAILKTMGASSSLVMAIFIIQGFIVGIVGTFVGTILGLLGATNLSYMIAWIEQVFSIQFLSADTYFISYLPSKVLFGDVILIVSVALVISLLATIYPAYRAAKVNPVQALRYE